jgi:hypothetical protein
MREHAGMKVMDGEFDPIIAGLEATFDEFKVPEQAEQRPARRAGYVVLS